VTLNENVQSEDAAAKAVTRTPPAPWLRRLPNQLTLLRILCIPLVVLLMLQGGHYVPGEPFEVKASDGWACFVFSVAAITDFLDGYLARRFGVETLLGKLLDPLADKLLVVSALIILVDQHRMASWIAVVLIVRDLGINAVRIAAMEENIFINSSWIGKTKTFLMDFGIAFLMVNGTILTYLDCRLIGLIFIWLALISSVWSAGQYLYDYARKTKASLSA
jgi:CDP-diacylglycerol--glycerol-3-phosphate 3-phosphatidyltransferase